MLNGEEIVGTFYKTELQKKTNQKEFRVKRKGDKLYVKCKGYNSSFNSLVDKRTYYKWVNIFQNQNLLEEAWKLN